MGRIARASVALGLATRGLRALSGRRLQPRQADAARSACARAELRGPAAPNRGVRSSSRRLAAHTASGKLALAVKRLGSEADRVQNAPRATWMLWPQTMPATAATLRNTSRRTCNHLRAPRAAGESVRRLPASGHAPRMGSEPQPRASLPAQAWRGAPGPGWTSAACRRSAFRWCCGTRLGRTATAWPDPMKTRTRRRTTRTMAMTMAMVARWPRADIAAARLAAPPPGAAWRVRSRAGWAAPRLQGEPPRTALLGSEAPGTGGPSSQRLDEPGSTLRRAGPWARERLRRPSARLAPGAAARDAAALLAPAALGGSGVRTTGSWRRLAALQRTALGRAAMPTRGWCVRPGPLCAGAADSGSRGCLEGARTPEGRARARARCSGPPAI